jgi:hypothetical protein
MENQIQTLNVPVTILSEYDKNIFKFKFNTPYINKF